MSHYFTIHPANPQLRLIRQAADIVRAGGVIVYPTDSCYALGCHIGDKAAMERMRIIRQVDEKHHFSLVCRDLSEVATYAKVDNRQYRLLKAATPGCYAFILEATREVPKRLQHPSRRTIGVRIPDHPVVRALLAELGEPLLELGIEAHEVELVQLAQIGPIRRIHGVEPLHQLIGEVVTKSLVKAPGQSGGHRHPSRSAEVRGYDNGTLGGGSHQSPAERTTRTPGRRARGLLGAEFRLPEVAVHRPALTLARRRDLLHVRAQALEHVAERLA